MDIDISVSEKDIENKFEEFSLDYAQIAGWTCISLFLAWSVLDYLIAKEVWVLLIKLRLSYVIIVFALLLASTFYTISSKIINYVVFGGASLLMAYFSNIVGQTAIPSYFLEHTIIFLGCSFLIIWTDNHVIFITVFNLGLWVALYYLFGRLPVEEMLQQGGLLFICAVVMGNILARHRYKMQKNRVRLDLANEKAKKHLYDVNSTLETQKNEIEQHKHEIDAQNEELATQNQQIVQQKNFLETTYQQITDSVRYAQRIQKAILGDKESITSQFKDSFIFYQPKDIVSGDFYWFTQVQVPIDNPSGKEEVGQFKKLKVLVAADCTGHGVPGAFMTVMGCDLLNEIINHEKITSPELILEELDKRVIANLKKQGSSSQTNDGMDIVIMTIDEPNDLLYYAGAKNPLLYVHHGELHQIQASPYSIGNAQNEIEKTFEKHTIKIGRNDVFYAFSDGFQDQFGGEKGKKYLTKRFRILLEKIASFPLDEQEFKLERELKNWQQDYVQTDDILVIGVRF